MQFIPVMESWIFSISPSVFSVTWSFRNPSTMLINVESSCGKCGTCSLFFTDTFD